MRFCRIPTGKIEEANQPSGNTDLIWMHVDTQTEIKRGEKIAFTKLMRKYLIVYNKNK